MNRLLIVAVVVLSLTTTTWQANWESWTSLSFSNAGPDRISAASIQAEKTISGNERVAAVISANWEPAEDLSTNDISPHPPSPNQTALMARYIVHYSNWGSLSHVSLQPQITGYPMARVYSLSDGPFKESSGVPYFYLTPNDDELKDMFKDPRASLTLTLAQSPYCRNLSLDPEDPRCAQVILTGKLVVLKNSTAEWRQAQKALFSRHPVMRNWPNSHHWLCCKLDISRILVADNFGGNKFPSVDEYFRARPNVSSGDNPLINMVTN